MLGLRWLAPLAAVGLALQAPAGPPAGQTRPATGLIVGQVLDATTKKPVPDAVVRLFGDIVESGDSTLMLAVNNNLSLLRMLTDADGRFYFSGLIAGAYSFSVTRPGYVGGSYGRRRVIGPARTFQLTEGERRADATILLWKVGAIGGVVTDEAGEPVVGVGVRGYRRTMSEAGPRLVAINGAMATTDDRGMYRLGTLIPGDYIVGVGATQTTLPVAIEREYEAGGMAGGPLSSEMGSASSEWSPLGNFRNQQIGDFVLLTQNRVAIPPAPVNPERLAAYRTTFYPSASIASEAASIHVAGGEEHAGVNLRLAAVPTYRVTGRLAGPTGLQPPTAVRLVPARSWQVDAFFDVATTVSDCTGAFTLLAVPAGEYELRVFTPPQTGRGAPPPTASTPQLWAARPITVAGGDVDAGVLTLQNGLTITARFTYQGKAGPPDPRSIVDLQGITLNAETSARYPLRREQDGTFSTRLPAGRYTLELETGQRWFTRAITLNGQRAGDGPIDLGADAIEIVVECTDTPPVLAGTVRDARGQPDPDATVAIFPVDRQLWSVRTTRTQTQRVSRDGTFTIKRLLPGDYFVAALDDADLDAWPAPAFLATLAGKASRVAMAEGEQRSLELRTIAAPSSAGGVPRDRADVESPSSRAHGPFVGDDYARDAPQAGQVRDVARPVATGTGVVSGRVVLDDAAGTPQRRARVTLNSQVRDGTEGRTATTDEQGRFAFDGVVTGRFTLQASKPGYLTASYGASRPDRSGVPIAVAAGQQVRDLTIRMARGGAIGGTVRDASGQPMTGATVNVLRYGYSTSGERTLSTVALSVSGVTDDRGAYRAWGLPPGQYVVVASWSDGAGGGTPQFVSDLRRPSAAEMQRALQLARGGRTAGAIDPATEAPLPSGGSFSYAPVFYPGTSDLSRARTITLGLSEERTAVDVPLQMVPGAAIQGHVSMPPEAQGSFILVNTSPGGPLADVVGSMGMRMPSARVGPDGRFTIPGLAPGQYRVKASLGLGNAGGGRGSAPAPAGSARLWAMSDVAIDGQDTQIELVLQPAMTIAGRVTVDSATDASAAPNFANLRFFLVPPGSGGNLSAGPPGGTIGADGTFSFSGVTPDHYRLLMTINGSFGRFALTSVSDGQHDVLDTGLDVLPGQDVRLTAVFTDRVTELGGVLEDASGRPTSDYYVIVFPVDRAYWTPGSRRVRALRPANDGAFSAAGLPAGAYFVIAVTDVEAGEWNDPAFLETLAAAAARVTLVDGQRARQDFRIAR